MSYIILLYYPIYNYIDDSYHVTPKADSYITRNDVGNKHRKIDNNKVLVLYVIKNHR